ncbi:sce7725 family protein [Pseudomonas tolaasii]|uniref:sce7725 family protein n=1 Tax=Pseudomonas tolaasii TaxID=29442 RepID=UPI0015A2CDC2|nr:sce7725 family protein [Pseudomonas tolaasii]NWC28676.1 sce7725 family protein [Pseudomonas tolaasii]
MYSPYLYGRSTELLALRSLIKNKVDLTALIPIVEPVVVKADSIKTCMAAYGEGGHSMLVVINPKQNEFKDDKEAQVQLRKDLKDFFDKYASLVPSYLGGALTKKEHLDNFFKMYPERELALIYNSAHLADAEIKSLVANKNVIYHVVLNEKITAAQLALLPKGKLVDVRDCFNKLQRNADYDGVEFFTDRHKLVGRDICAVGDYTITGRSLDIGGGKPGAVAIHLSYKNKGSSDIWMEHFVSDDKDRDVGDVSTKFLQAAGKLVVQVKLRPKEFGNDAALQAYKAHVVDGTFSGLPKNKEYQIYHHVCLMLSAVK